jgi:hypothetical protein
MGINAYERECHAGREDEAFDADRTVKLANLTDAQLRALLDWDPDLAGVDNARQILLTAARNRFPEEIPASMVQETA